MRRAFRPGALLLAALLLSSLALETRLEASDPTLSIIMPRGIQRGVESVLTFSGARLEDAQEVFFYEGGFEVVKIEPKNANSIAVTVKVAADCTLGEHTAQVRTATGISDYKTFYVGALPIVEEKEPNSLFEEPQLLEFGVTVHGVVQNEDVDYFVVEAKKGERISVDIEGMRLGSYLFDPYVAILDMKRFELVTSDDHPLAYQDAVASVVAPEDGKYVIEVHESSYGGNGNCRYRMHVGHFPRPTAVYPAGGKMGEETEVRFLGDPTGDLAQKIAVPTQPHANYGLHAEDAGGLAPTANPFRPFEHGNALEQEPNNEFATSTPAQLPLAFNGIINAPGDVDCFKFAAKKGQVFEVECYARRIRSGLDPVMNIYYANGKSIAGNDDSRGPDSYLRFSCPADGEYIVRVTDHLSSGQPDFVYRVEFTPVQSSLALSIPRVRRYSQDRQRIYIAKGNRFATLLNARRTGIGGEMVLEGLDLPAGVKMIAEPMPANMNQMPVVFEAAADAPTAGKLVDFTGKVNDGKREVQGGFTNTADLIRGGPGQSIYWTKDVNRLAFAVVEELPFKLEIVQPKAPLVRNGSMQLKIVAHRKEGFDEQINVQFPFRPAGLGAASSVNIPKGKNEALYPINANANAAIGNWPVYVLGTANVNGAAWVASQMAHLEIAAPFVQFAMQRAACEQGQETAIVTKVQVDTPFEGKATATLVGLPDKVTAEPLEFDKGSTELAFAVKTVKESRAGQHKNVFCQVVVTHKGEPVVHRMPSTVLRIDVPIVPKKPAPTPKKEEPKVAKKEAPKPPVKKPLSRLEQLRLEAQKQAAAAAGNSGAGEE